MTDGRARRALVTRPADDAAEIVAALLDRGIEAVLAPMMRVVPLDPDIDADAARAQAVLFTSRNGVRAFCAICDRRDVPVLAVGDSTARLAAERGFGSVESAGGDSADLARLVAARLRPADGPLLHASGDTVAGTLAETLSKAGFRVIRRSIYAAEPVEALSPEAIEALRGGELDFVLLFSPRTARLFAERVRAAGLESRLGSLTAICLSPAVAAETAAAEWARCAIAARPTTQSLLAALDADGGAAEDRG
jgi:uroporphyrinogen-III synthase